MVKSVVNVMCNITFTTKVIEKIIKKLYFSSFNSPFTNAINSLM